MPAPKHCVPPDSLKPSGCSDFLHLRNCKMVACMATLLLSLIFYGIAQERIMTHDYGEDGKFQSSLLLVFVNRSTTVLVACTALLLRGEPLWPTAPMHYYVAVSFTNILASACQFEALKYVSFPVQTLVKCGKMIPVMLWGSLIMNKTYKLADYVVGLTVMLGCSVFLLTGEVATKHHKGSHDRSASDAEFDSVVGAVLLLIHLACDGFASTFQDKLFGGFQMSFYAMTFHVTGVSSLLSLTGLIVKCELVHSISFVYKHSEIAMDILGLALAATTSQLLISYTIRAYGALLFATVQTTRQFLSILISCVLFSHIITTGQAAGTAMVFGALFYKALQRRSKNKTDCHNADNHQIPTSSSTQELQALIKQDDMIGELNLPLLSPKLDQISTSALTSNVAPVDAKDLIDVGARSLNPLLPSPSPRGNLST
mmetsp:Transcript_1446/g.2676  ORF Transcript_1446/g.2676 Transcript_1446/m.2676 type:complete len:428 (-) Transcript_1446:118-1401(-)|eukprot:CAMPEP_0114294690 /NCGR_PEP_ID=MMETSP0059-20121206/10270_1 /TAXON_ID=36894 /ORGANISM="Pyramimonas parkeae, Strain CCMP726" /LENGTH=427 /DNA_ID=CAMNT_0001416503 /DNA_START=322 /DNA_END=1605 /DNA_ORIENTATION=+